MATMFQPSTSEQLNRILALTREFSQMVGRSSLEVTEALLATRTLGRLGYRGDGRIATHEQAEACIQILQTWIWKKKHEH